MLGQVVYKVNQTVLPCDLSPGKLTWRADRGRCARIPKALLSVKQSMKKEREMETQWREIQGSPG